LKLVAGGDEIDMFVVGDSEGVDMYVVGDSEGVDMSVVGDSEGVDMVIHQASTLVCRSEGLAMGEKIHLDDSNSSEPKVMIKYRGVNG
jgi:hypothetical protein